MRYRYEKNTGQFRNLETGRFAPFSDIENALEVEVTALQNKLGQHGLNLADGRIDISTFQRLMAQDIKDSHIRMAAMGAGGNTRLTKRAYASIGGRLKDEYVNYLYKFGQDLADPSNNYSKQYIIWRSKLYARSPKQSFHAIRHITLQQDGDFEGLRYLDESAKHCAQCPGYVTTGYVDLSRIVPVGTRCDCRGNCKCKIKIRPKLII